MLGGVLVLDAIEYVRPRSALEALQILRRERGKAVLLAGGTNLLVDIRAAPVSMKLIDVSDLSELKRIETGDGLLRIGPGVCQQDLVESVDVQRDAPILAQAARKMAGPQIRSRGTIGGNIADGSPAADLAVALLALDATVDLERQGGKRSLPLEDFFVGPGQTALQGDEMITSISFPKMGSKKGTFIKLGLRNALAISVVSVAVTVEVDGNNLAFRDARIALGAVAPKPIRSKSAELALKDRPIGIEAMERAALEAQRDISPISDIRASADYRRAMTKVLVQRALEEALASQSDPPAP